MLWNNVLGKISKINIPEDKPIKWKFLKLLPTTNLNSLSKTSPRIEFFLYP